MTRPLCRYCGKPIRKATNYLTFGCAPIEAEKGRGRCEQPRTREEAQRFVNGRIVSVRWSTMAREDAGLVAIPSVFGVPRGTASTRSVTVPRYISEASYWDGQSYAPEWGYFCTVKCAAGHGQFAARHRPDLMTKAYFDAREKDRKS